MNIRLRSIFCSALLASLALVSVSGTGNATTISTGDITVFDADVSNAVTGNFASVPTPVGTGPQNTGPYFGGYNPLAGYAGLQGVSFSTPNLNGNVNVDQGGFYGPGDLQQNYAVNSTYSGSAPDVVQINLPHSETAFALDFDTLFASTTATFVLSNGFTTQVATPSTFGATEFLGFVSSTPFDSITLSVPNGQSYVIADFTQASALATPLPASWSLMASALLVMCAFGYRQARARA